MTRRSGIVGSALAGLIGGLVLFGGLIAVGRVGDFQALRLLEATLPTTRFLASTVIGASMTVLALMLTILSLSLSSQWRFTPQHYHRISQVTALALISVVAATAVLVAIAIPLDEVEELHGVYDVVYYLMAGASAVLGGLVVAMTVMIGASIHQLTSIGAKGRSEIVVPHDEDAPNDQDPRGDAGEGPVSQRTTHIPFAATPEGEWGDDEGESP